MGVTERRIRQIAKTLKDTGYLTWEKRPYNSNAYDLTPLFEALEELMRQDGLLVTSHGLDEEVAHFLEAQDITGEFYRDICQYLDNWLPHYATSNRSYMTVALGCTGGQHRSVYLANRLYQNYKDRYENVHIRHRELQ